MNELEYFLLCGVSLVLFGWVLFSYIGGDFTIMKTELVDKQTVDVYEEHILGVKTYSHKKTIMVYKITYLSEKIKFKTITYKH